MENWLTGHIQRVVITDQTSEWFDITCGVLELALVPVLFLQYISVVDNGLH